MVNFKGWECFGGVVSDESCCSSGFGVDDHSNYKLTNAYHENFHIGNKDEIDKGKNKIKCI